MTTPRKPGRTEMVACMETRNALVKLREANLVANQVRKLQEEYRDKLEECRGSLIVAQELRYGGKGWHKGFLTPQGDLEHVSLVVPGSEPIKPATDEELRQLELILEAKR